MFTLLCQQAQHEMFIIEAVYAVQYKPACALLSEGWDG
jgi:hypothetical protein